MPMQQQSSSSQTQFSGIDNPAALQALLAMIASGGKTGDYLAQRATREAATKNLMGMLGDYSNEAAFSDAADLMKLNLQQSLEKQMPAMAKSVQGAGTSASSMQGLLSNKIAQDAALGAGALGAEQAKAYAQAMGSLQGTLEQFTRTDNTAGENLLKALQLSAVSRGSSTQQSSASSTDGGGGGGGSSGGGSRGSGGTSSGGWSNGYTGGNLGAWSGGGSVGSSGSGSINITPSGGDYGWGGGDYNPYNTGGSSYDLNPNDGYDFGYNNEYLGLVNGGYQMSDNYFGDTPTYDFGGGGWSDGGAYAYGDSSYGQPSWDSTYDFGTGGWE